MAEEKIANIMREFVKTMETGDVEKGLSLVTEDVEWVTPNGTFKGKGEVRRLLSAEPMQGSTVTETGNGIIVEGNKAFFEHVIASTFRGRKAEVLAMCAYEFKGDKIQKVRVVMDRLLMAQQATGGLPKMMVNLIVKQSEKMFRIGKG